MLVELLVRTVDKVNANDKRLDAQCRKAGDVICWKPTPTFWGRSELDDPGTVVIRANLTEAQAKALVAPEIADVAIPLRILRKNQLRLDLAAIASLLGGEPSRSDVNDLSTVDLLAVATLKEPLLDTDSLLSPSANVIGGL